MPKNQIRPSQSQSTKSEGHDQPSPGAAGASVSPARQRPSSEGAEAHHDPPLASLGGTGGALATAFDIVALAASAGGLAALSVVLAALPADFPASVVVVQHLDPKHRSLMADIINRRTPLPVKQAAEGDQLCPGHVYIAPPDHHLLVNSDGSLSLTHTELVHFVRPSADLLFESVAASYKQRALAVVLTGSGHDGAMGIRAIKKMGGMVIVQDEQTSEFFGMPGAAIQTGGVDFILPLEAIAPAIGRLVTQGVTPS